MKGISAKFVTSHSFVLKMLTWVCKAVTLSGILILSAQTLQILASQLRYAVDDMTSPQQSCGIPPFIEELLADNKNPAVSTTEEVNPSPPTAAEGDSKGQAEEELEKELVKGSSADIKKELLNKWLEDCQRIIALTITFVNSEMTNSSSSQERDLLDKMKHDIGMTQSAIEFVITYDVHNYANKEEAEAKLMEAMMLIMVQVRGMKEVFEKTMQK